MIRFYEAVARFLEQGGLVMLPLAACAFGLWDAIGSRVHLRRARGRAGPAAAEARLVAARTRGGGLRRRLEVALGPFEAARARNAVLARSVVLIAPLLGLLGTVTGMIELFDSLGTGTFQAQEGGIAAGIAQALFTTELGLAIAIPGFFATRVLERREARLRAELLRLVSALIKERAR